MSKEHEEIIERTAMEVIIEKPDRSASYLAKELCQSLGKSAIILTQKQAIRHIGLSRIKIGRAFHVLLKNYKVLEDEGLTLNDFISWFLKEAKERYKVDLEVHFKIANSKIESHE